MKILKKILIAVVIIAALPFIAALFIKREYTVERNITINRHNNEVFNYIKILKNQDQYNKWVMVDPNMKKELRGTDGTVGFVYAWNGNDQAGQGEQMIKSIEEGKRLDTELHFIKPFEGRATTFVITEPLTENQTSVRWSMSGKSNYPMNFMNLFMEGLLGKDMDKSLITLKSNLEQQRIN